MQRTEGGILNAAIAANRFGLGARPGDLEYIGGDARGWLKSQIGRADAFLLNDPALPSRAEASQSLRRFIRGAMGGAANTAPGKEANQTEAILGFETFTAALRAEIAARAARALTTQTSFAERLVRFWSNHFTVAANKAVTVPFAGLYEREVIRTGMTGSFADLHLAVMRHPGMLLYLDQAQSIGPNSLAGKRRNRGLNENLAREALELHTMGAQGGYGQSDVTEFAKALTGWTVVSEQVRRFAPEAALGDFVFIERLHEPGTRTVLGKRYPEGGESQARAILADLARHPATARRVASSLARHFIADEPPIAAVAKLEKTFRETEGDVPALHETLVDLPETFDERQRKFKTSDEFILSALRMTGVETVEPQALYAAYALLGQRPFSAPSPEGWPDNAGEWAAPDAVMKRLEWSEALARRLPLRTAPAAMAAAALGSMLSARMAEAVARAASGPQGLTLALMSPEFQRR
ncbi:MAG: DUF1800 family protein [Parvularculaceae bacterium]